MTDYEQALAEAERMFELNLARLAMMADMRRIIASTSNRLDRADAKIVLRWLASGKFGDMQKYNNAVASCKRLSAKYEGRI